MQHDDTSRKLVGQFLVGSLVTSLQDSLLYYLILELAYQVKRVLLVGFDLEAHNSIYNLGRTDIFIILSLSVNEHSLSLFTFLVIYNLLFIAECLSANFMFFFFFF